MWRRRKGGEGGLVEGWVWKGWHVERRGGRWRRVVEKECHDMIEWNVRGRGEGLGLGSECGCSKKYAVGRVFIVCVGGVGVRLYPSEGYNGE